MRSALEPASLRKSLRNEGMLSSSPASAAHRSKSCALNPRNSPWTINARESSPFNSDGVSDGLRHIAVARKHLDRRSRTDADPRGGSRGHESPQGRREVREGVRQLRFVKHEAVHSIGLQCLEARLHIGTETGGIEAPM